MTMPADHPVARSRKEVTTAGEMLVIDLEIVTASDRLVCVLVDDLDSAALGVQDLRRLRKLLQVMPRRWPAVFGAVSGCKLAQSHCATTIGEVVDGAFDLEALFLSDTVRRRGRASGSFLQSGWDSLEHVVSRTSASQSLLVVLTDGRLHDIEHLMLPEGVACLGLALGAADPSFARWRDVVPNADLHQPTRADLVAAVRRFAGCAFLGPCIVDVAGRPHRVMSPFDSQCSSEGDFKTDLGRWDFSLGTARLEIPLANSDGLREITIRSDAGLSATVSIDCAPPSSKLADGEPEGMTVAHSISATRSDAVALIAALREISSRRGSWQDDQGKLAVSFAELLPDSIVTREGRPQCDAMLVLIAEEQCQQGEAISTLWLPLSRESPVEISDCWRAFGVEGIEKPVDMTMAIAYHRFDARWIVSTPGRANIEIPPRGGSELTLIGKAADGTRILAFFSGEFRHA